MSSWKGDPQRPDPKEIAAYVDGELDGDPRLAPMRRGIEKWLAEHPEASDEVNAQRQLSDLWQATTPAQPDESVWRQVSQGVAEGLRAAPLRPVRPRVWPLVAWGGGLVSAAAAVVWIMLTLFPPQNGQEAAKKEPPRPDRKNKIDPPGPIEVVEIFEVATADEIEILRIAGADTKRLPIGRPPVEDTLVLVGRHEISFQRVNPADDKTVPEVRGMHPSTGNNPMVWSRVPGQTE